MSSFPLVRSAGPVSRAGEARWIEPFPGERIALRARGSAPGSYALVEAIIAPMAGPPLHLHHDADEVFHLLDGHLDFVCDGRRSTAGPGDVVRVPKGSPHAFRNFSGKPARMMVTIAPAGFEGLMLQMVGRDPSEVARFAARFALEIVGPQIEALDSGEA